MGTEESQILLQLTQQVLQLSERLIVVENRSTKNEAKIEGTAGLKHEERLTRMERIFWGAIPVALAISGWLMGNIPKVATLMEAMK